MSVPDYYSPLYIRHIPRLTPTPPAVQPEIGELVDTIGVGTQEYVSVEVVSESFVARP